MTARTTDAWGYPIEPGRKVAFAGKEASGNITFNMGILQRYDPDQDRWLIKRIWRSKGGKLDDAPRMIWVATWKIAGLPTTRPLHGPN